MTGNSGPYLQYAHARARRILEKVAGEPVEPVVIEEEDKDLVRKLAEYSDVQSAAIRQLQPHLVCHYLFELAQTFNRYYEKNHVVGDEKRRTAWIGEVVRRYTQGWPINFGYCRSKRNVNKEVA